MSWNYIWLRRHMESLVGVRVTEHNVDIVIPCFPSFYFFSDQGKFYELENKCVQTSPVVFLAVRVSADQSDS